MEKGNYFEYICWAGFFFLSLKDLWLLKAEQEFVPVPGEMLCVLFLFLNLEGLNHC